MYHVPWWHVAWQRVRDASRKRRQEIAPEIDGRKMWEHRQQKSETSDVPCQRYQEQCEGQMGAFMSLSRVFNAFFVIFFKFCLSPWRPLELLTTMLFMAFASNVSYHVLLSSGKQEIVKVCRQNSIVLIARSPVICLLIEIMWTNHFDNLTGRPKKVVKLTNNSAGLDRSPPGSLMTTGSIRSTITIVIYNSVFFKSVFIKSVFLRSVFSWQPYDNGIN